MIMSSRVKQLRLEHAWSQEHLAELADVNVRTIQRVENGEKISNETLSALASVFNLSIPELVGDKENGSDDFVLKKERAEQQLLHEKIFYQKLIQAIVICSLLFIINRITSPQVSWFIWAIIIEACLLTVRGIKTFILNDLFIKWQQGRLNHLLRSKL